MTKTYIALDAEFCWDEHLFEAHRAIDRKSERRAVAVKRVMAAAVFQFTIDDEGRVSTGEIGSWSERDWGDEEGVVSQLFDYLRANDDKPVLRLVHPSGAAGTTGCERRRSWSGRPG